MAGRRPVSNGNGVRRGRPVPQPEYVTQGKYTNHEVDADFVPARRTVATESTWGVQVGIAAAAVILLPLFFGMAFSALDRPDSDAGTAAFGYGLAGAAGLLVAAAPFFAGRGFSGWTFGGLAAGAALAIWLVAQATQYTSDRVCTTHHGWFWSGGTDCSATPGGGPELAMTAAALVALALVAIGIAAAAGQGPAAGMAAQFVSSLAGAAYGAAGLVLLVLLPEESSKAHASNQVQEVHTTPGFEAVALLVVLGWLAVGLRRRLSRP